MEQETVENKVKKDRGVVKYILYFFEPILIIMLLLIPVVYLKSNITDNIHFSLLLTYLGMLTPVLLRIKSLKNKISFNFFQDIKNNFKWKNIFIGVIVGVGTWLSYVVIFSLIIRPDEASKTVDLLNNGLSTPLLFLTTGLTTPIIEELFFRYIPHKIVPTQNKWFYIFISSIMFALYHVDVSSSLSTALYAIIGALYSGLIFSFVFYHKKDIFTSIIAHSTFNLISISILVFTGYLK